MGREFPRRGSHEFPLTPAQCHWLPELVSQGCGSAEILRHRMESPPPRPQLKGIGLQRSITKKLGWAGRAGRGLQLIKATAETAPGWPGAAFLEVSTGGFETQAEPSSKRFFIQISPHGPRLRPQ